MNARRQGHGVDDPVLADTQRGILAGLGRGVERKARMCDLDQQDDVFRPDRYWATASRPHQEIRLEIAICIRAPSGLGVDIEFVREISTQPVQYYSAHDLVAVAPG